MIKKMQQNFLRSLSLTASMVLGDEFQAKTNCTDSKNFAGAVAPSPPLFHVLQELDTMHYLPLELTNGFCQDFDSNAFASMAHLNFQLENKVDSFKSILEGFLPQKVLPILKRFLYFLN